MNVDSEEAREKLKQEALLAWKNFQERGLHLTYQEVDDWLNTWGTAKKKDSGVSQIVIVQQIIIPAS